MIPQFLRTDLSPPRLGWSEELCHVHFCTWTVSTFRLHDRCPTDVCPLMSPSRPCHHSTNIHGAFLCQCSMALREGVTVLVPVTAMAPAENLEHWSVGGNTILKIRPYCSCQNGFNAGSRSSGGLEQGLPDHPHHPHEQDLWTVFDIIPKERKLLGRCPS